jgi:hypothetical protein
MEVIALIDYDNVRPNKRERNDSDTASNIVALATDISRVVSNFFPSADLRLRFYGGWLTRTGQYTIRGEWILRQLELSRGRFNGVRCIPELACNIAAMNDCVLLGSYRGDRSPPQQKMVDTMISVDTLFFAQQLGNGVLVVSDDDDIVPCVLACTLIVGARVCLLRRRPDGHGINDHLIKRKGVQLISL